MSNGPEALAKIDGNMIFSEVPGLVVDSADLNWL